MYEQESNRKKKKKNKRKDKKHEKRAEEFEDLDEDDYDLIGENLNKRKKLRKINRGDEDAEMADFDQIKDRKRVGVKRDRADDDYEDEAYDIKKEHGYDKASRYVKKYPYNTDKQNDSTMEEEEQQRPHSHQLRDNFITDDIDDLFGTP